MGISILKPNENLSFDKYTEMFNSGEIQPFICLNSETDKNYEAYGVMPSPSYLSDVECVGDNANMLNIADIEETEKGGVKYSAKDGILKLNGTATDGIRIDLASNITVPKGTYTHSCSYMQSGLYISFDNLEATMLNLDNPKKTFTLSEDTTYNSHFLWIDKGFTLNNVEIKLKLEKGKIASPFSSYNMGCASFVVSNKNELNFEEKTTSWAGSTVTVAGNKIKITGSESGVSGLSYSSNRKKVDLRKGTTITYFSKYVSGILSEGNTYYHLYGVNSKNEAKKLIDMSRTGATNYKTDKQVTYTLEEDIKEIYISGSTYYAKGLTEELVYEFQLEIGDIATEIIEHTEQTKVVDIQQPMLEGDYFIKEEDGWKEVHGWKYGTFNANNYGVNNDGTKRLKITCWGFQNKANCEVLCKYIKNRNARWDNSNEIDNAIYGWDAYGSIGINVSKEIFSTSADFRIWALENNLGFYYQLATPLKLACTETQNKQLDDLLNTSTYKNITHIYSTDKVSPIIKVKYRKDIESMFNIQQNNYETRLSNIEKLLSTTTTSALLLDNLQSDLESEVI